MLEVNEARTNVVRDERWDELFGREGVERQGRAEDSLPVGSPRCASHAQELGDQATQSL